MAEIPKNVEVFSVAAREFRYYADKTLRSSWMEDTIGRRVDEEWSEDDRGALEDALEREAADEALTDDEIELCDRFTELQEELSGWYWWNCLPGCLPDSDAFGPFDTEREAIDAAREDYGWDDDSEEVDDDDSE